MPNHPYQMRGRCDLHDRNGLTVGPPTVALKTAAAGSAIRFREMHRPLRETLKLFGLPS